MPRFWTRGTVGLCFLALVLTASSVFAVDVAPRISDREIIEALSELKEGQKGLQKYMDQRLDLMQKSIDQRFESMEKSMDQRLDLMQKSMDRRFDMLQWILGLFITIALTILYLLPIICAGHGSMGQEVGSIHGNSYRP